ncbi:AAA family ATPase [Plantactinospora sp. B6F1]|uniref:ATP-dependent nuclease n=1 Tax=Plantactinospora sp. B6F1 TaxID=3158971 RepID=UPI0032D8DDA4
MRLTRVYVRFFKSFNFDYERRANEKARRATWEILPEGWYPHVRLDVDPQITAIVGANESGKSHLLDAIECVMGKREVTRSDFCRYSQLFSVETDEVRIPDVGAVFTVTRPAESEVLATLDVTRAVGETFLFMRPGEGHPFIVADEAIVELDEPTKVKALEVILPQVLRFSTSIAVPDSVPIASLWGGRLGYLADRRVRGEFLEAAEQADADNDAAVSAWGQRLWSFFRRPAPTADSREQARQREARALAKKLLIDVARIDESIFKELQKAIDEGKEGEVSGLEGKINESLARHLNLSRWWSQDNDFTLRVTTREREIVFTIRDRTGAEYSFGERSRGLTHFLAYFVQLRAHRPVEDRDEILLMDEPDAYLSNSGQQDLLRVLENFAIPDDRRRTDQVIYVTHSPFLINKNAADRLRVLDKGAQEEGTRVVRDVARTHYEPLRSSLGSYVAETAFIGGKNLIVEGSADQVMLAGMSNALRIRRPEVARMLDLNEVTIVPAGSADSVPYIAYLARGRDPIKPPCVALLDGDDAGRMAVGKLKRSEANRKPVLDAKFVVCLDTWATNRAASTPDDIKVVSSTKSGDVTEIEDLIHTRIAVYAARNYATRLLGLAEEDAAKLRETGVKTRLDSGRPLWDCLKDSFTEAFDASIDKVGFAREVVNHLNQVPRDGRRPAEIRMLEDNFIALLSDLTDLLEDAAIDETQRRRAKRMGRIVRGFLDDYRDGASRTVADSRLREIESSLDDSAAHDDLRIRIAALRRDFSLRTDPTRTITDFPTFRQRLEDLTRQERLASQDPDVTVGPGY